MVRILVLVYVAIQIALLAALNCRHLFGECSRDVLTLLDILKFAEIVVFIPIIFILARRTRDLRRIVLNHESVEEIKKHDI